MGGGHMAHELGITKPTIRNDHRRCQRHAASAERRHTSVQHELEPVQFVAARRPRAWGGRPTNGKVDGDDQFALAQDDHEEEPVNAREDPMFLPTPPGADSPNCSPYFLNTESSPTQVHCQRLRVAALALAAYATAAPTPPGPSVEAA